MVIELNQTIFDRAAKVGCILLISLFQEGQKHNKLLSSINKLKTNFIQILVCQPSRIKYLKLLHTLSLTTGKTNMQHVRKTGNKAFCTYSGVTVITVLCDTN